MKKHSNKELVMTKKDSEDFKTSTRCWICDNEYVDGDVKVKHCHVTGKHKSSAYRDCNMKVNLNHKITVVFHNLKNCDSHLDMQQLGKFNFKINIILYGLEKCMSFSISNKLVFVDSFQFLS